MNEYTISIVVICVFGFPLTFAAGYIVGRAGGFRELFEPPELLELPQYPTMQDVFTEMRRRDMDQRDQEARERVEQRLAESRKEMTT